MGGLTLPSSPRGPHLLETPRSTSRQPSVYREQVSVATQHLVFRSSIRTSTARSPHYQFYEGPGEQFDTPASRPQPLAGAVSDSLYPRRYWVQSASRECSCRLRRILRRGAFSTSRSRGREGRERGSTSRPDERAMVGCRRWKLGECEFYYHPK